MVVIRLQRLGTKKQPHHRIVVTEQHKAQSSRVLEIIGHYNPGTNPPQFLIKAERLAHWKQVGGQVSEAAGRVIKKFGKAPAKAA